MKKPKVIGHAFLRIQSASFWIQSPSERLPTGILPKRRWTVFLLLFLGFSGPPQAALAQQPVPPLEQEWQTLADLRASAQSGNPAAQFMQGQLYESGRGVERDLAEALRWYRLAAAQQYPLAEFSIGALYDFGEGVEQNFALAREWYERAARQGLAVAQHNLGNLYADGMGVAANPERAVHWFRLAAQQGFVEAQYNLGYMYASGEGVPTDFAEAFLWWRMAAEQGDLTAERNLERLVERLDDIELNRLQRSANERLTAMMQERDATRASASLRPGLETENEAGTAPPPIQAPEVQEVIAMARETFPPDSGTTQSGPQASQPQPTQSGAEMTQSGPQTSPSGATTRQSGSQSPLPDAETILDIVSRWASAWSAQNVDAYLAAYAPDFRPEGNQTRNAWARQRTQRIESPSFIRVEILDPRIVHRSHDRITVQFRQRYSSDRLSSERLKSLELIPVDGRWLIQSEKLLD